MKKMLSNMSIQKKLIMGFFIVILLTMFLSVVSVLSIKSINNDYIGLQNGINKGGQVGLRIGWDYATARRYMLRMAYTMNDPPSFASAKNEFYAAVNTITGRLVELESIMRKDEKNTGISIDKEIEIIEGLLEDITVNYSGYAKEIEEAVMQGRLSEVNDIVDSATPLANQIRETLDNFINGIVLEAQEISEQTSLHADRIIHLLEAAAICAIIVSIICAIIIAQIIRRPIIDLSEAAKKIAAGNLDTVIRSDAKDEIGKLSNMFGDVVDVFTLLVDKINHTYKLLLDGELDVAIDESVFPGSYQEAASAINNAINYLSNNTFQAISCMNEYGDGNFSASIKRFNGPQAVLHESLDTLQENLKSVNNEIGKLIKNATAGNFNIRIESSRYKGDWRAIADGLNQLVEAVDTPVTEVSNVLLKVANANFNVSVNGDYRGKFHEMKAAVNHTVNNTAEYIQDISGVLEKMSNQDLNLSITKEYEGDFRIIKSALIKILDTFNKLISEFRSSAEQVAAGAGQISEASMMLAQGATQQANSVQELNATIEAISMQTSETAKNSEKANILSGKAKRNGVASRHEMEEMLENMDSIEDASTNISKIIKVIDDIAFQTNLLALNAAVEAARAGEHGKGFAVVAEEVRSLAGRSKKAASETTELINKTVAIVSKGNEIANRTAVSLNLIVEEITEIALIIDGVSIASKEQDLAVSQIREGIGRISEVIHANASLSEESASSSQELTSQAELFRNALGQFELRVY